MVAARTRSTLVLSIALAALVVASLAGGLAGGLARAGSPLTASLEAGWLREAALSHAFLMISAFMGTVIALERAVAIKAGWAYLAPALGAASGLAALAGWPRAAGPLSVAAALVFVAANVRVVRRQPEPHTALLLAGALAWVVGNALHAASLAHESIVPWWFSFLVLTIAAERLEMTRLMRRRAGAAEALHVALGAMVAGAALAAVAPAPAWTVFGAALVALAAWLLAFDIARRTVRAEGLSRYMAVCLLVGYLWLAAAGAGWIGLGLGYETRDLALHGLGLGFVFGMMLAHAPVILPAVAGVRIVYGPLFYLPLAALHLSLAIRLFAPGAAAGGATGNALAIALFAATMAGAALAWRRARSRGRAAADRPR